MEWIKVRKVWLMRESERMFEVSTSGSNTDAETFTPLVDGVIDKALLYTSPHVNQTALQIVQILDLCPVNSVLHNAPDLVVDRIKVWAIRRPQIWRDECRCVTFQEIAGALSCWKMKNFPEIWRMAGNNCWESSTLRSTNINCAANFDTPTDTITERLKVDHVYEEDVQQGYAFSSTMQLHKDDRSATVKTFSSVNHMKLTSLSEYLASSIFDRLSLAWRLALFSSWPRHLFKAL